MKKYTIFLFLVVCCIVGPNCTQVNAATFGSFQYQLINGG